jgi:hypothetical protein
MSKTKTPRFFLYRLQTDNGTAPNINGGVCTLALCKPMIRRSAKIGDYIIGLRGRSGELGKLGPHAVDSVLYVMRVTQKMTMAEYDAHCSAHLPIKIPSPENDYMGDCQYTASGEQRTGPHSPSLIDHDLGGKYVLLSDEFWYRSAPAGYRLPAELVEKWDVPSVARGHRVKTEYETTEAPLLAWLATFPTTMSHT